MSTLDLRSIARRILDAALAAVEPGDAVRRALERRPDLAAAIAEARGRVVVAGAGKAGAPMAAALVEMFPGRIAAGCVVVPDGHAGGHAAPGPVRMVEAAHPVPDGRGEAGAAALVELVRGGSAEDLVVCVISGGASALLAAPAPPLALDDLRQVTALLLRSRAAIGEINAVRRHLSRLQGGRLAALAAPARVVALVLSDVVGDPPHDIGSGPTAPDPTSFADVRDVLVRHALWDRVPAAVARFVEAGLAGQADETLKPGDPVLARVEHVVVAGGRVAAEAAVAEARRAGLSAALLTARVEGEARGLGRLLAALAWGLREGDGGLSRPGCWVLSGETTVLLGEGPPGRGGRNHEAALAAGVALAGCPGVLVACAGTDGVDGNTDAAGAFADGATWERARARGLDAEEALRRHDSHTLLAALGETICTGPTLTNVGDLALVLAS